MEGRCLWIQPDDVDGPIDEGHVVRAAHPLSDWCLRGDDGSEPVAPGAPLEIIDVRPWGKAMAREMDPVILQAALELQAAGLFVVTAS